MPDTDCTPPIERLVYRSRALGPDMSADMEAILKTSVWYNAKHRITGALGRFGSTYVQVLEGSSDSLDILLGRLRADPRHTDVVVLLRDPVPVRSFPGWSMARADLQNSHKLSDRQLDDGEELTRLFVELVELSQTSVVPTSLNSL